LKITLIDDTGQQTIVEADTRDLGRYRDLQDSTGWGDPRTDPIRSAYGIAWLAARRTGAIPASVDLEAFRDLYELEAEGVDPTPDPTDPANSAGP
jgi:hypothetical protein